MDNPTKIRTVIIDDEEKGRKTLKNFAQKYAPNLSIAGEADDVESGVKLIDAVKPELVFLDIQMPGGTGFDLLGKVAFNGFNLIFCSAYDQFAVKAFRFSAIDYLLKPLDPDVFISAINKLPERSTKVLKRQIEVLTSNRKSGFNRIALHSFDGISIVNIDEILRCESSANYTTFKLRNQPDILVTKTLKEFDDILTPHHFLRVHKSHLINLAYVTTYLKGDGGWIKMVDGSTVEVSRRKREQVLEALSNN